MDADLIEWCRRPMMMAAVAVSSSRRLRPTNTSLRLQSSAKSDRRTAHNRLDWGELTPC
jgi:hypothetical protein